MMTVSLNRLALLLATSALCTPWAARAQSAEEVAALRAEIQRLKEQVSTLEMRLDAISAPVVAPPPASPPAKPADETKITWKGAPELSRPDGWSFKPRGRVQADIGFSGKPKGSTDRGLGFASELRRARFGAEGTMPGGFGFRIETEFSDNATEINDAYLTWTRGPLTITAGQHNAFWSLEELTSDSQTSFMERAAFTDAFEFERRVGVSAAYLSKSVSLTGSVFTDNIADLANAQDGVNGGDENNSYGFGGRGVWFPVIGRTQWHLGGSAYWRDRGDLARAPVRYRQRPFLHTTNTRFLSTAALGVESETGYGAEFAAIRGAWHVAAEIGGLRAGLVTGGSASFLGGYGEIGYYLTGETRGYKAGFFNRTKVLRPLGKGGAGAFQIVLRYDALDLNDGAVIGGTQKAYLAALVWTPIDLMRVSLNAGWLDYRDALLPDGSRADFGTKTLGMRAEIDF